MIGDSGEGVGVRSDGERVMPSHLSTIICECKSGQIMGIRKVGVGGGSIHLHCRALYMGSSLLRMTGMEKSHTNTTTTAMQYSYHLTCIMSSVLTRSHQGHEQHARSPGSNSSLASSLRSDLVRVREEEEASLVSSLAGGGVVGGRRMGPRGAFGWSVGRRRGRGPVLEDGMATGGRRWVGTCDKGKFG